MKERKVVAGLEFRAPRRRSSKTQESWWFSRFPDLRGEKAEVGPSRIPAERNSASATTGRCLPSEQPPFLLEFRLHHPLTPLESLRPNSSTEAESPHLHGLGRRAAASDSKRGAHKPTIALCKSSGRHSSIRVSPIRIQSHFPALHPYPKGECADDCQPASEDSRNSHVPGDVY